MCNNILSFIVHFIYFVCVFKIYHIEIHLLIASYQMSTVDHITSMTCISACGKVLPNLLIYSKSLPTVTVNDNLPKSWLFASSENGIFLNMVKVGVLRPVQQPGSYWDRSSELPLVGLEPRGDSL